MEQADADEEGDDDMMPLVPESDEDSSETANANWRENSTVSRKFYQTQGRAQAAQKSSKPLVDERLIELLERMPKNKRIALHR